MTEKDFLKLFNDIGDRYIEEEQREYAPVTPIMISHKETKHRHFSFNGSFAAAAACFMAAAGLFAAGIFSGGGEGSGNVTSFEVQESSSEPVSRDTSVNHTDLRVTDGEPLPVYTLSPAFEVDLLDGGSLLWNDPKIAHAENVKDLYYRYSVNGCYGVPFFTPSENRTAGEKGDWFFLSEGSAIGKFNVKGAKSEYYFPFKNEDYLPYSYKAEVDLSGELSCTAQADFCYNNYGNYRGIMVTLDKEACRELFSLKANIKVFDGTYSDSFKYDFDEERICFVLYEGMEGYEALFKSLAGDGSSMIRLSLKDFTLSYSFQTGLDFDGTVMLKALEYKLDILE